ETVTLFEATILSGQKLARVDILRKQGNDLDLIEVKAKLANPFRGANDNTTSEWRPYLEDVTFQYSVLRSLFPTAKITPYLCLVDKAKTTTIESIFSKFQLSESSLSSAGFRRPKVTYTGNTEELRRSHFLSQINVAGEVRDLLPGVERS